MLISERVDFTGSTEDVTDRAEGMQNGELKILSRESSNMTRFVEIVAEKETAPLSYPTDPKKTYRQFGGKSNRLEQSMQPDNVK